MIKLQRERSLSKQAGEMSDTRIRNRHDLGFGKSHLVHLTSSSSSSSSRRRGSGSGSSSSSSNSSSSSSSSSNSSSSSVNHCKPYNTDPLCPLALMIRSLYGAVAVDLC